MMNSIFFQIHWFTERWWKRKGSFLFYVYGRVVFHYLNELFHTKVIINNNIRVFFTLIWFYTIFRENKVKSITRVKCFEEAHWDLAASLFHDWS